MESHVRRFLVRTRDKTKTGTLMPRPLYVISIGADLLAEVSTTRFGVYKHIYTMTDVVLAEMAYQIARIDCVTPRDSAAKKFSLYLRNIGLPPFLELDDPNAVIELHEEIGSDETIIDVSSGVEPFICSGSTPLIPRRIN